MNSQLQQGDPFRDIRLSSMREQTGDLIRTKRSLLK